MIMSFETIFLLFHKLNIFFKNIMICPHSGAMVRSLVEVVHVINTVQTMLQHRFVLTLSKARKRTCQICYILQTHHE